MKSRGTPLVIFFALSAAASVIAQNVPKVLTLQDQFGNSVDIRIGSEKIVVIILSEKREAAEEIAAWENRLGTLPPDVVMFRVANLRAIPFFVPKGSVTKELKESYPTMSLCLDWKGVVSSALSAPKRETAVIVFGPGGVELARVAGQPSASGAAAVNAALSRAGR